MRFGRLRGIRTPASGDVPEPVGRCRATAGVPWDGIGPRQARTAHAAPAGVPCRGGCAALADRAGRASLVPPGGVSAVARVDAVCLVLFSSSVVCVRECVCAWSCVPCVWFVCRVPVPWGRGGGGRPSGPNGSGLPPSSDARQWYAFWARLQALSAAALVRAAVPVVWCARAPCYTGGFWRRWNGDVSATGCRMGGCRVRRTSHGGSRMGWLHSLPRVKPWDPSRLRTATRVIVCPLGVWMIVRCARLSLVSCGMRVQQSQAPASHVRPACARTGRELTVACVCALACPARARTGIGASREHAVRLRVGRRRARVPTQATPPHSNHAAVRTRAADECTTTSEHILYHA